LFRRLLMVYAVMHVSSVMRFIVCRLAATLDCASDIARGVTIRSVGVS